MRRRRKEEGGGGGGEEGEDVEGAKSVLGGSLCVCPLPLVTPHRRRHQSPRAKDHGCTRSHADALVNEWRNLSACGSPSLSP